MSGNWFGEEMSALIPLPFHLFHNRCSQLRLRQGEKRQRTQGNKRENVERLQVGRALARYRSRRDSGLFGPLRSADNLTKALFIQACSLFLLTPTPLSLLHPPSPPSLSPRIHMHVLLPLALTPILVNPSALINKIPLLSRLRRVSTELFQMFVAVPRTRRLGGKVRRIIPRLRFYFVLFYFFFLKRRLA